jgi:hypothetical protein
MLRRLISSCLVLTLFTASASANRFAQPPPDEGSDPITVPVAPPAEAAPAPEPAPEPVRHVVVTRDAVRAALVTKRAQSLELFRLYWRAGIYPHNTFTGGKLNVWLDDAGHLCAAATIISGTGFYSQVMQQAAVDNFIRLKDVKDGWLLDWMLTSGLTQEELVAIQLPFEPGRGGRLIQPVPMPDPGPDPRFAEVDRRLRKGYVKVDRMLVKQARTSLDKAVDRLMERPELAEQLLLAVPMPADVIDHAQPS